MANLSNINNVLRVSSDLRVGINTDAASYALEIGGTNSGIKLKNSGGSGKVYSVLSDTSGNFQIYDDAAASGRLIINSAGNATFAGVITTETGGSVFGGSGGIPIYARSTGTVSYMQFQTSSTGSNGSSDGLTIGVNGSTAYIWQRENEDIFLGTNDTTAVVIDNSQNVGIGVTTPETPLHVLTNTTDNASTMLIQNGSTGDASIKFNISGDTYSIGIDNSDGDKFKLSYGAVGTNDRIVVDPTGNVGIGTNSPAAGSQLTLRSSASTGMTILSASNTGECFINFSDNDDANVGQIFYGHSPDRMAFRVGDDTRMTILGSNGNVGIGVTSPTYKLQVAGTTLISGGLKVIGPGSYNTFQSGNDYTLGLNDYNSVSQWWLKAYTTGDFALHENTQGDRFTIKAGGNVGIGTTNPSSELEVAGRAIVEKLEVARYSDSNAPAAVYVGRSANPIGQGGIFRLGAIESSSTVNKIDEPFLITYSSGHWGSQPMFFAEFTITFYRGSYIKYWAQHEVSGSRLEIVDGPYGGQIISGGAPVSRTITQLCTNCHSGQPVYKCVWKWSNSGTYIKTSPIVSLADGPGTGRVYTSGSSSESAIDTLYGSASSPGTGYLLMGIDNAQAAGFTGLQTQN